MAESKKLKDDKEKYNYLKNQIDKNENYLSSNDIDYLISVSELMSYIVYYCGLPEKFLLAVKPKIYIKKFWRKIRIIFFALLGTAIGYMHAPAIAGGSDKKAFEYFNKALYNSNQKYQKYLIFRLAISILFQNKR